MYIHLNTNPLNKSTGDCIIRALSVLLNKSWDSIYCTLCTYGFKLKEWGNSAPVWESYLKDMGFKKSLFPDTCPNCYTIKDFCKDVRQIGGDYLLVTDSHVVVVKNGGYYIDTWDSGNEIPIYYWRNNKLS